MSTSPTPAELLAIRTGNAALLHSQSPNSHIVETVVFALGSAQLLQSPETAAEQTELLRQRNAFREQRNAVFSTNEELLIRVERAELERLQVQNENRTLLRRVAELEQLPAAPLPAEVLAEVVATAIRDFDRDAWDATQITALRTALFDYRDRTEAPAPGALRRPVTEAYLGELFMFRGLVGVLRVVAPRGDMAEVQRLLAEHAADEQDAHAEDVAPQVAKLRGILAPSPGELAEQRHLVDPLDHVLEHLADERPAVTS